MMKYSSLSAIVKPELPIDLTIFSRMISYEITKFKSSVAGATMVYLPVSILALAIGQHLHHQQRSHGRRCFDREISGYLQVKNLVQLYKFIDEYLGNEHKTQFIFIKHFFCNMSCLSRNFAESVSNLYL